MKQALLETVLKLLLVLQTISFTAAVIESMCAGTGYINVNYGVLELSKVKGAQDTGWNRLYPKTKDREFIHAFWTLDARFVADAPSPTKTKINFLEDDVGNILSGWLHIDLSRKVPFHNLAIWAVNERNEVYGNFVFDKKLQLSCSSGSPYYRKPQAYIPCSAVPINYASVPNMFVYANLKLSYDASNNFERADVDENNPRVNGISLIWKAHTQDYCNRPEKFRFIVVTSGKDQWESWNANWTQAKFDGKKMKDQGFGPFVWSTNWIFPEYFGHATRHDTTTNQLKCGDELKNSTGWVVEVRQSWLDTYWKSTYLWSSSSMPTTDGNWQLQDVLSRSTCKGSEPQIAMEAPFGGRCRSNVYPAMTGYITGYSFQQLTCADGPTSPIGTKEFRTDYKDYLDGYEERFSAQCECVLIVDKPVVLRSLRIFLPKERSQVRASEQDTGKEKNEACFLIDKIEDEAEKNKAGICIHNKVGTLVYGVRQWHGVTSLCVTLIITPLSIFIARYSKGEMVLIEGKVPIKGWYLSHILLVFPAIWMYASGFATISRQKDVLGESYTGAAQFHRTLGIITFSLIPLQFITGFIRPTNLATRRVVIFLHWIGGILQHILELILCIFSTQIPASPTSSKSLFSPEFGYLTKSIVACLVFGWFLFSACFHICLMIRIKRQDISSGMGGRSIFPIIIPMLSTEARDDIDMTHLQKDIWFERGALLIFSLVSCIVFAVSIVSLYQALHDNLYYGFGPMSCTHQPSGLLVNATSSENKCN